MIALPSESNPRVLCDRHIGDAYPPRCEACESLTREYEALKLEPPVYPQYKLRTTEQAEGEVTR